MTTFRIKRSPTSGNPSVLAQGELAYSYLTNNGSNGGDTLYIGTGTETTGNAANHVKIGGLYYTTQIDNATSSNTASTLVKRDSSGNFSAGTITAALTGNASTSTKWASAITLALNGDATASLSVDGSGNVTSAITLANVNSNAVSLATTAASGNGTTATITYATQASNPFTVGQSITVTGVTPTGYNGTYIVTAVSTTQVQYANTTTGSQTVAGTVVANFGSQTYIPVITVNAKGLITAISNTAISTTLSLAAGGSTSGSVNLNGGTFTVTGGAGIATSVSGSTLTISSTGAGGYTTTVTSGTTYTLTSSSTPAQYFTGSTGQTVALPSTSGLSLGQEYILTNNSTANLSVQTSSTAAVLTQIPGTTVSYTVISTSGNTASAWNYEYTGFAGVTGTGNVVLATSPTISAPTITGHPTVEGVTSTGATGTGKFVFDSSPTITTPTIVTSATFNGSSSGSTAVQATASASGTLTLPAATDTLVGKATTDIFTNKTFDTAGTGNVFKINGTQVSAVTGTGSTVVLSAGPTLTGTIKLADISISTDTISNTTSSTNIIIAPTGKVQFGSGTPGSGAAYQFPAVDSTSSGYVLTSQANGQLIWAAASSTLSLAGTGSTSGSTNLLTGTLTFAGGTNVTAAISGSGGSNTVTISVGDATTSTKGIASFNSTYFSVSSGAVSPASVTGTNAFVLATSPTITTPSITTSIDSVTASFTAFATPTSITFGGASTATTIGASTGTLTLNNPTIATSVTSGTLALFNTGLTGTLNIGGAAGTINIGSSSSTTNFNGNVNVASGKGYQINGTTVLSGTTLGSTIVSSSLTSVGTITSGTWNGTTVAVGYGGTGTTNGSITGTGALTFTAGGSNTNINLVPQGTGTVDVGSARITSVATPTQSTDAATKGYVDAAATGINVHDSVEVLADSTNTAITGATYANGTTDAGTGTGIGATLTDATTGSALSIDGYTLVLNDRVLVNAFTSTSAKYNGVYYLSTLGVSGTTKWVLTRATDYNNSVAGQVIPGDFAFVTKGTTYGKTGWVQTNIGTGASPANAIKIGTDAIAYTQFSGSGTYLAGNGIALSGSTFSIDTSVTVDKTTAQTLTNKTLSTGVVYNGGVIGSTYGGTGVNNGSSTITIGGSVTLSGAYTFTGTLTANTSVTFPTSGTLVNTAVTTLSSLSSIGTITVGVWNGTTIASGYGGTGFNTYATGDTIYASATNTLSKLSIGTTGQIMQVNSSGVPVWADLDGGTY